MRAAGTFAVTMTAEPPYDATDGITLARVHFAKVFTGGLEAQSTVNMIGARTPVADSAGYVAIERVVGRLDGRAGTFILQHSGTMSRGESKLAVSVVPDSGTGELTGLGGHMAIEITAGEHRYTFNWTLAPA